MFFDKLSLFELTFLFKFHFRIRPIPNIDINSLMQLAQKFIARINPNSKAFEIQALFFAAYLTEITKYMSENILKLTFAVTLMESLL